MGLQEQIAEAIIIAFDELGGDPQSAVDAALRHDSIASWVQQETTKIAVAGGAEMLIPGLHALTIPAGISYLLHKMAHITWGIGALKGAYIVETARHSDLRNVLTLWANSSYYNAHLLDYMAISLEALEYALTQEGAEALAAATAKDTDEGNVVVRTLLVLQELALDFGGDERAQRLYASLSDNTPVEQMVLTAKQRPAVSTRTLNRPLDRRMSTRLALQLSARISARVPARLAMGFIPLAGAVVNAFFNAQTLQSMVTSADKYYDNLLSRASLQGEE